MTKLNHTGKKGMLCSSTVQIAFLLHLLSYGTDGWANNANEYQGLWNFCNHTGEYRCCQTLNSFVTNDEFSIPTWLTVVRAIQSLGLMSSSASLLLIFLYTILESTAKNKICKVFSIILCSVTGGLILLGCTIYGSSYRYEDWLISYFLDFSFGLSITSGVLYIIAAILVAVMNLETQVSPSLDQQPPVQSISRQPTAGLSIIQLDGDDRIKCKICIMDDIDVIFQPCKHACACRACAYQVDSCPLCRREIEWIETVYL